MQEIKYIYEDEDILVCHKPSGVATEGARIGQIDVISAARNYLKRKTSGSGGTYVATVHRLDQPVEGVLILAKNKKAASDIAAQIKNRKTDKFYYALCYGSFKEPSGKLSDYLVKREDGLAAIVSKEEKESLHGNIIITNDGKKMKVADQDVKKAELLYEVIAGDDKVSLLRIKLLTGRFHQIRAQLSAMGHPILGEKKYGTEESVKLSMERGIDRICLVCYKFAFDHPKTKKRVEFEINPENIHIEKWIKASK